uniref:ATP synthase complex subunit 8 n=1 Tax=Cromeria occidentalis TaxID=1183860 RepID=Q2A0K4_9TELE|nr:ATPase subunits 8 [Cromeria occidentalis]
MPQLNPTPWFTILLFSWLMFLTVLPPKVMKFNFNNEPTPTSTKKLPTEPWNWPWH